MPFKEKKCPECDDKFIPRSGRQKYCSDICASTANDKLNAQRVKNWYDKNRKTHIKRVQEGTDKTKLQEYQQSEAFKESKKRYYQKNKNYYMNKQRERRARLKEERAKDEQDNVSKS